MGSKAALEPIGTSYDDKDPKKLHALFFRLNLMLAGWAT